MKSTLQKNVLLAEFMGAEINAHTVIFPRIPDDGRVNYPVHSSELKYHISWDSLMPVVEKINEIAIDNHGEMSVTIYPHKCSIGCLNDNFSIVASVISDNESLLQMVWSAVIKFIEWYNSIDKK